MVKYFPHSTKLKVHSLVSHTQNQCIFSLKWEKMKMYILGMVLALEHRRHGLVIMWREIGYTQVLSTQFDHLALTDGLKSSVDCWQSHGVSFKDILLHIFIIVHVGIVILLLPNVFNWEVSTKSRYTHLCFLFFLFTHSNVRNLLMGIEDNPLPLFRINCLIIKYSCFILPAGR